MWTYLGPGFCKDQFRLSSTMQLGIGALEQIFHFGWKHPVAAKDICGFSSLLLLKSRYQDALHSFERVYKKVVSPHVDRGYLI